MAEINQKRGNEGDYALTDEQWKKQVEEPDTVPTNGKTSELKEEQEGWKTVKVKVGTGFKNMEES